MQLDLFPEHCYTLIGINLHYFQPQQKHTLIAWLNSKPNVLITRIDYMYKKTKSLTVIIPTDLYESLTKSIHTIIRPELHSIKVIHNQYTLTKDNIDEFKRKNNRLRNINNRNTSNTINSTIHNII